MMRGTGLRLNGAAIELNKHLKNRRFDGERALQENMNLKVVIVRVDDCRVFSLDITLLRDDQKIACCGAVLSYEGQIQRFIDDYQMLIDGKACWTTDPTRCLIQHGGIAGRIEAANRLTSYLNCVEIKCDDYSLFNR